MAGGNIYFDNKSQKWLVSAGFCIIVGGLIWYTDWTSGLSKHTVLHKSVPEWTTYIIFATFIGGIAFTRAFYLRTFNKTRKYLFEAFMGGFAMGFVLILNCYDVYIYLFADNVIRYESEYEVVFPGPSVGKTKPCEAGLWIKDQNTSEWIQFCTSNDYLHSHRNQGMTRVLVTARINSIGTYIMDYKFIYE